MKYIVYYDTKGDGKLGEMCGTDGFLIPDQRYSIRTLIDKVLNREIIRPRYAKAFSINEGYSISVNHNISGLIELNN